MEAKMHRVRNTNSLIKEYLLTECVFVLKQYFPSFYTTYNIASFLSKLVGEA